MLKVKLTPTGKRNLRQYRIVVAEDRQKLTGRIVEYLGTYNPHAKVDQVVIDKKLYEAWLKKGAQPTPTIKTLVAKTK